MRTFWRYAKLCFKMYITIRTTRTIESLYRKKSKTESFSKKLLYFYNKKLKKKMILVMGVTTRKRSEGENISDKL